MPRILVSKEVEPLYFTFSELSFKVPIEAEPFQKMRIFDISFFISK